MGGRQQSMRSAAGLRVIEAGEFLSGAYCGLALSGQGAEVVQVRDGLDRRLDRYESAYFDRGRLTGPGTADLQGLLPHADVLLTDLSPGRLRELGLPASEEDLDAIRPGLVHVAITSFGLSGSHADYEREDITDWAGGGLAFVTRRPVDPQGPHFSPVLAPARQPEQLAGMAAVLATYAGLRLARGSGRAVLADVCRQEVQVAMAHQAFPNVVWSSEVWGGPAVPFTRVGHLVPTADGYIYVRALEDHQWLALAEWMGIPPEVASERTEGVLLHHSDPEAVQYLLEGFCADQRSGDLYTDGQRRRIPIVIPAQPSDVLASPQLAAREAWVHGELDGAPYRAPALPLLEPLSRPDTRAVAVQDLEKEWSSR
jgi:crotonobetainyl-CoA:carnitine CoA-transferase CaiB-like acyl-CoA transferase